MRMNGLVAHLKKSWVDKLCLDVGLMFIGWQTFVIVPGNLPYCITFIFELWSIRFIGSYYHWYSKWQVVFCCQEERYSWHGYVLNFCLGFSSFMWRNILLHVDRISSLILASGNESVASLSSSLRGRVGQFQFALPSRLTDSLALQEVVGRAKQFALATVSCLMRIVWIQRRVGKLNKPCDCC